MMEHLLQGLYGVDAPAYAYNMGQGRNPWTPCRALSLDKMVCLLRDLLNDCLCL